MSLRTFVSAAIVGFSAACATDTPTSAVVANDYPPDPSGDVTKEIAVYKVWWATTLFTTPMAPGESSEAQRTVPVADYAYALLAPGWDPTSTTPPTSVIPVRTNGQLSPARGDTLAIVISDHTVSGNCGGGTPLAQADADFITQRIFPGEFAAVIYDAATCTTTPVPTSTGGNGGAGGGS